VIISNADAALMAEDLVELIIAEAAETTDPARRAELDHELDGAYEVLERATELAAEDARRHGVAEAIARRVDAAAELGPSPAVMRRIAWAHQRSIDGKRQVREMGLDHLLKPRGHADV
jgi:hypothetical protein